MTAARLAGPVTFSGRGVALFAGIGLAMLLAFAFDVWMLTDAVGRPAEDFNPEASRILWIAAIVVGLATSIPGLPIAIAYDVIVRRPAGRASTYVPATMAAPPPVRCTNCHAVLAAGARYCHSCGTHMTSTGRVR